MEPGGRWTLMAYGLRRRRPEKRKRGGVDETGDQMQPEIFNTHTHACNLKRRRYPSSPWNWAAFSGASSRKVVARPARVPVVRFAAEELITGSASLVARYGCLPGMSVVL